MKINIDLGKSEEHSRICACEECCRNSLNLRSKGEIHTRSCACDDCCRNSLNLRSFGEVHHESCKCDDCRRNSNGFYKYSVHDDRLWETLRQNPDVYAGYAFEAGKPARLVLKD